MRHIKTQTIKGVQWGYPQMDATPTKPFDAVLMEKRDYRLMRAVVRMAESKQYDIQKYLTGINRAVDALNKPRKTK